MTARVAAVLVALVALTAAHAAAAARTVDHYPVANGIGTASLRLSDGRLDSFRPAPYAALDQGIITPELAFDAYAGARVASSSTSTWLTDVAVSELGTVPDANAVRFVQHIAGLRIETKWLAPYALERATVLLVIEVTNETAAAVTVDVPTIANFRMGTGPDANASESASYDEARDAVVETRARGALVARALGASTNHTMTPSDPWPLVRDGLPLPTVDASGIRDNVVFGFTFSAPNLAPGASATFGVLYVYTASTSTAQLNALQSELDAFLAGRTAAALFDDEVAASQAYVESARAPLGLSVDERALFGHSLAFLRAAQVRDEGTGEPRRRPRGQIVASLPPGIWNITWVRDAAYAGEGLLAAGMHDETAALLRFFLDGDAGEYASYVGTADYLLSVTRVYGGGREESDFNAGGPNIEWDNFGLFLSLFARALDEEALDEGAQLAADIASVKSGVADVLLSLVDVDTGLLVPDSSIWETHWDASFESQGRRQYAYSSAMASAGLRAFGQALVSRGDADGDAYLGAADALAAAIASGLVRNDGLLVASREELGGSAPLDAAVVEAFNRDVLDAQSAVATSTLAQLDALRAPTPGYIRNDEGGDYDSKEWLVIDLWLARAFRRAGGVANVAESERLIAHVTEVGLDNLGQIPELLDDDVAGGRADGAIPMMGFGAGAYLSALADRANDLGLVGEGEGEGEPGEGEGEPGEGEGEPGEGEGEPVGEGEGEPGEGEGEPEPAEPGDDDEPPRETEGCASTSSMSTLSALALALLALGGRGTARRRR